MADILPERLQPFLNVKAFQNKRPLDLIKIRVIRRIILLRIIHKHESFGWVAGRTGAALLILYLDVHFLLHLQFVFESSYVLLQPLDGLPEYLDVLVLLFDYFQKLVLVEGVAGGVVLLRFESLEGAVGLAEVVVAEVAGVWLLFAALRLVVGLSVQVEAVV